MSLAVLSDDEIRQMLENLSRDEAEGFAHTLKCALHEYSTGTQTIESGLVHQPERQSVHSHITDATTLFMPSASPTGHGVKVVTVSSPSADSSLPTIRPTGSMTVYSREGTPIGFLHAQSLTAFRTALASSCLLTKRSRVHTLTVFGSGLQAYWHVRLALMLRGQTIRHIYIINRRFSDNAKHILKKFYAVPSKTKQQEGWEAAEFSLLTPGYGEYNRLQKEHIRSADVIYCCTPSLEDLFDASILTSHEGRRKGRLIVAVGSYKPEMREIPLELLIQATRPHQRGHLHYHRHAIEGGVIIVDTLDGALKEAGEIIQARLAPKQLVELGELAMIHRLAREEEDSIASQSSNEETSASSITDSIDKLDFTSSGSALSSVFGTGSSVDGNSNASRDKEDRPSPPQSPGRKRSSSGTGSHFSLPSFGHHRRSSSQGSSDRWHQSQQAQTQTSRDDHLARWLSTGNVIYKSVGLGLMDLVVGLEVVKMAKEKGVGTHIEGFSTSSTSTSS